MRADEDFHMKDCETGPGDDPAHGSFGEFLAELRSLFPSALVGASGWERLLALAHRLPIHVIDNRFGFEFDLCDPDPAADFCTVPLPGSRLAGFHVRQGRSAPPDSTEAALGAFLAAQAEDTQDLPARGGVILEYDLVGVSPEQRPAAPGVFITWARHLLDDPDSAVSALWAVAGWQRDAGERRQVQRIYEALPPDGHVSQAGVMPGRVQRALRLIVTTRSGGDAVGMLRRLKWPGSLAEAAAVSESLAELTRPGVALSIDATAQGISPRLGLEFHRPVEWHQLDPAGWSRLIDLLTERDWCLSAKAGGLKAWPRVEQVFEGGGVYRVRQSINHVKVVVDRDRTTAKAYAGTVVQQVLPRTGMA